MNRLPPVPTTRIRIGKTQWLINNIRLPAELCNKLTSGRITFSNWYALTRYNVPIKDNELQRIYFTLVNGNILVVTFIFLLNTKISLIFDKVFSPNAYYISSEVNRDFQLDCTFSFADTTTGRTIPAFFSKQQNNDIFRAEQREQQRIDMLIMPSYKNLRNALAQPNTYIQFLPDGTFEVRKKNGGPQPHEITLFKGIYSQQPSTAIQQPRTVQEQEIMTVDACPVIDLVKEPEQARNIQSMDLSDMEDIQMTFTENSETVEEEIPQI